MLHEYIVYIHVFIYDVCVCVCEREREREREYIICKYTVRIVGKLYLKLTQAIKHRKIKVGPPDKLANPPAAAVIIVSRVNDNLLCGNNNFLCE